MIWVKATKIGVQNYRACPGTHTQNKYTVERCVHFNKKQTILYKEELLAMVDIVNHFSKTQGAPWLETRPKDLNHTENPLLLETNPTAITTQNK